MNTNLFLDSKAYHSLNRLFDLILLNFFYLLTCIPIVTIGAARTALYTVCFRFGTDRETGIVKGYFLAFRDNFKQATLLWTVVLMCNAFVFFDIWLVYSLRDTFHYGLIVFVTLLTFMRMVESLIFPLLSQFNNRSITTVRNSLIFSMVYCPIVLVIAIMNALPFILMYFRFKLFLEIGYLWITLYFSAAAYLNTFLFRKILGQYLLPKSENMPNITES